MIDKIKIYQKMLYYISKNVDYKENLKYAGKIYQGFHQPIFSEEPFNLAQDINHKKIKILRVYNGFLFRFVSYNECNSAMTPYYTNKRKDEKLNLY